MKRFRPEWRRRALFSVTLACILAGAPARLFAADETAPPYESILKIDAHSHVFEDHPEFHALFRRNNVRTINVCNDGTEEKFKAMHRIAIDLYRKHPDIYPFESTFDLTRRNERSYVQDTNAWLEETFRQGAVGVKIWKEIGIEIKRPDGSFAMPDDALFDPIYAFIAKRGKVLHAHLAEPIDAWLPLDKDSAHYGYYSKNPQWHLYGKPEYPSHAAIIAARDRIMEKHPTLVVLGAHLGSLERDLEGIAVRLDRYPNFYIECADRTRELTRHPSDKVRDFIIKYQDRFLYGVDGVWKPYRDGPFNDMLRRGHINRLELQYRADYDYFAGSGEITYKGRKVQALNLPRTVLEKFYHRNAQRLFKLDAGATPSLGDARVTGAALSVRQAAEAARAGNADVPTALPPRTVAIGTGGVDGFVAVGGDGMIHVVYGGKYRTGPAPDQLGPEETITDVPSVNSVRIAIDGAGRPHVVFNAGKGGNATRVRA